MNENDFIQFLNKMNAEPFLSAWLKEWELFKEEKIKNTDTDQAKDFIGELGLIVDNLNEWKERYKIDDLKKFVHPMIIENKFTFAISDDFIKSIEKL